MTPRTVLKQQRICVKVGMDFFNIHLSLLYNILLFKLNPVWSDLKHQLQEAGDGRALMEKEMTQTINTLCLEKDVFINLSVQRGKVVQVG